MVFINISLNYLQKAVKELANVTARSFSIVFEMSWQLRKVPEDWKKTSVTPAFKKGKKEDEGNCGLVILP